jgi:hypothetical protein
MTGGAGEARQGEEGGAQGGGCRRGAQGGEAQEGKLFDLMASFIVVHPNQPSCHVRDEMIASLPPSHILHTTGCCPQGCQEVSRQEGFQAQEVSCQEARCQGQGQEVSLLV